jgi:glycosyltransferase involved in cell wall biosynthesis
MRVALDAGPLLGTPTGVGRYVAELIHALPAREVQVQRFAVSLTAPADQLVRRWKVPARAAQTMWMRGGDFVPKRLFAGCDVVHGTNFVLPPTQGRAGVVTVHDLSYVRPDVFPGGERLRRLVPWSLERADVAIAPTQAIADEIVSTYRHDPARVEVVHEGVSPTFFGATPLSDSTLGALGIPGRFVLAVGTLEPRKNLKTLIGAWRGAAEALRGWRLVLAGPSGWGEPPPEAEGVMRLGYVDDATLPGLMAAAEIFCYPSHYEGFGLPPLEAMAAGTACIAGRYSAAEEVLGDAAVLVEPDDTAALIHALASLAGDEARRRRLALEGRAQAARYTWDRTAEQTRSVYRKALGT